MKIAVLGTRGFPGVQGGVETHCENLYTRLAKMGFDVTVFTRCPYTGPAVKEYKGVKLVPLPCPRNKYLETLIYTFNGIFAVKRIKPDVLHIHAIGPSIFVPLARLLGLKVVMTHHGPDYDREKWGKLAKLVLKLGEWAGVRFANQVIAISRPVADLIKLKFGRTAHIIPNGVVIPGLDEKPGSPVQQGKLLVGASCVFPGKYLLAVGRFVPEKGFSDLMDAWSQARKTQDWKLVIAGDADHEGKYSLGLKEKAKADPSIVLTGFITGETLKEIYCNVGLFVLPSYHEGLSIVLLEAMSYGLSCVASDIPANREMPLDNDRYFTPGDVNALTLLINRFIGTPISGAEKVRQIAALRAKFDWDTVAADTSDIYRGVLRG